MALASMVTATLVSTGVMEPYSVKRSRKASRIEPPTPAGVPPGASTSGMTNGAPTGTTPLPVETTTRSVKLVIRPSGA